MRKIVVGCSICMVLAMQAFALETPAWEGRVTDLADIFDETQEAQLTTQLETINENTLAEVALLTIPSLAGEDIDMVGTQVAQEWGVGNRNVDNGILVLIAPNERQRRIDVGYGLEGDLPDAIAFRIGNQLMVPYFRNNDYYGGVSTAIDAIGGLVEGTYTEEEILGSTGSSGGDHFGIRWFLLLMLLSGVAATIRKRRLETEKEKNKATWVGTAGSTGLALLPYGMMGLVFFVPFLILWALIMLSKPGDWKSTGGSGWSSGSSSSRSSGGSSFGGGFSGFSGGSFGGGGASGGW